MSVLLETPWPAIAIGGLTAAILIGGFLRTAQGKLLLLVPLALAVTVGLVLLERAVVTEREAVENTLQAIAAALERDATDEVLGFVASDAAVVRGIAQQALKAYVIREAKIKRNLQVTFPGGASSDQQPTQCHASFNAVLTGGDRGGLIDQQRYPLFFEVDLVREGDAWKVAAFEYKDFQEGLQEPSR